MTARPPIARAIWTAGAAGSELEMRAGAGTETAPSTETGTGPGSVAASGVRNDAGAATEIGRTVTAATE